MQKKFLWKTLKNPEFSNKKFISSNIINSYVSVVGVTGLNKKNMNQIMPHILVENSFRGNETISWCKKFNKFAQRDIKNIIKVINTLRH